MSDITPSMSLAINEAIDAKLLDLHTTMVAKVVKVDVAKALCDVQPVLKRKYGDGSVVALPVITNVPIAFYRAGAAFISMPIHAGDYVKLEISERSLDLWLEKGGIIDPEDPRKFNITDAIAYPGVYPKTSPPDGATANDVIIKNATSKITLKPDGTMLLEAGNSIINLMPDGTISVTGTTLAITAPTVTMSGNLVVTGAVTAASVAAGTVGGGAVTQGGMPVANASDLAAHEAEYASHTHGGVQAGGSNTSTPN